jgi:hypothetical protein
MTRSEQCPAGVGEFSWIGCSLIDFALGRLRWWRRWRGGVWKRSSDGSWWKCVNRAEVYEDYRQ